MDTVVWAKLADEIGRAIWARRKERFVKLPAPAEGVRCVECDAPAKMMRPPIVAGEPVWDAPLRPLCDWHWRWQVDAISEHCDGEEFALFKAMLLDDGRGCARCGVKPGTGCAYSFIQFDHRDSAEHKDGDVRNMLAALAQQPSCVGFAQALVVERDRCDLLCRPCHVHKTTVEQRHLLLKDTHRAIVDAIRYRFDGPSQVWRPAACADARFHVCTGQKHLLHICPYAAFAWAAGAPADLRLVGLCGAAYLDRLKCAAADLTNDELTQLKTRISAHPLRRLTAANFQLLPLKRPNPNA